MSRRGALATAATILVGDAVPDVVDAGAAYVFELRGDSWEQVVRLQHPSPRQADAFGAYLGSASVTDGYTAVGTFNNSKILRSRPGLFRENAGSALVYATRPLISYAPDPGFEGNDRLSYSLRNQEGDFARANVKIRVEETGVLSAWSQAVPQRR